MKHMIQIVFSALLLIAISCQNGSTDPKEISDSELIQAIIDADKISIGINDLPSNSKTVIEYDYTEYDSESAKKAYGLGYEVNMAGKGHKVGSRCEVYFNLEGRRLDPYGKNGDKDKSDWDRDEDKGDWKCFDLVLPVTYVMPDRSTITVGNENDWDVLKDWYEANPESEEKPELQFPVNVEFDDREGTANILVSNEEEMREVYSRCGGGRDDEDRECINLVLPISYTMPDGSTITVENEEDWITIRDWYEANPESDERPTLQFPVDIMYETEDGDSTLTVNNDEEMEYVKRSCREEWDDMEEDEECYEYVLPISFTMPDGTTIVIENEEGWLSLREWYVSNGEAEEEPLLQYPVNIVLFDDEGEETTVTINNEEEMNAVDEECWGDDGEGNRP